MLLSVILALFAALGALVLLYFFAPSVVLSALAQVTVLAAGLSRQVRDVARFSPDAIDAFLCWQTVTAAGFDFSYFIGGDCNKPLLLLVHVTPTACRSLGLTVRVNFNL